MASIRDSEVPAFEIGDVFYECEMGMNIEARVTSKPVEGVSEALGGKKQWTWDAVNTQNDEPIQYMLTESLSHYGPRLYREPQYAFVKDGEFYFPLLGRD